MNSNKNKEILVQQFNPESANKAIEKNLTDTTQEVIDREADEALIREDAIIGAMLLFKETVPVVMKKMTKGSFFFGGNRGLFSKIQSMFNRNIPIDLLTVTGEVNKDKYLSSQVTPVDITLKTERVGGMNLGNLERWIHLQLEYEYRFKTRNILSQYVDKIYTDTYDIFEELENLQKELGKVVNANSDRQTTMATQANRTLDDIERRKAKRDAGQIAGYTSGCRYFDEHIGELEAGNLVILAGRPGMGKTAVSLYFSKEMARAMNGEGEILFFTLEMSSNVLMRRIISSETGIDSDKLKKGTLTEEELEEATRVMAKISDLPLTFDDDPNLNLTILKAKLYKAKAEGNLKYVFIDYLQLIDEPKEKGENRDQVVGRITRQLKILAKELDIVIICLCQLNRDVEKRGGAKRPQLSDLRESGSIEQDADMVIMLYRPGYYQKDDDEEKPQINGIDFNNILEMMIVKNREGAERTLIYTALLHVFRIMNGYDNFESKWKKL